MKLYESNLQDLEAMTQIVHSCREHLNLESEIRWSKESLQQAMTQSSVQVRRLPFKRTNGVCSF